MFYAEHSTYGTTTLSDSDTLYRFRTREERDAWVYDRNNESDEDHWAVVKRSEVEHRYDFGEFDEHPLSYPGLEETCYGNTPEYIHMRVGYII